jgi:hypothetical protein
LVTPTIHLYDETCLIVAFDGRQWNALHDEKEIEQDSHRFFSSKFHLLHPEQLSTQEEETLFKAHFSHYQAADFVIQHEKVAKNLYLFWAFTHGTTPLDAKGCSKEHLPKHHIASTWLKGCLRSETGEDTLHCMEINQRLYIAHIRHNRLLFYQSFPCTSHSMLLYYIYQSIQELHLEPETTFFQCLTEMDLDDTVSHELQVRIAKVFLGNSFEGLLNSVDN